MGHIPSECDNRCNAWKFFFPNVQEFNDAKQKCIDHYTKWQELDSQNDKLKIILRLLRGAASVDPAIMILIFIRELVFLRRERRKINSKQRYLDLPLTYLIKSHTNRFDKIKNKYSKEIQREKISTIGDIAEFLSKVHYQTPPNPNNLLVECEEHIENIDSILNAEEIAFSTAIINTTPRSKFYQNINSFFAKTNKVLNDSSTLNHSNMLSINSSSDDIVGDDVNGILLADWKGNSSNV